jgi:hypothetical protein
MRNVIAVFALVIYSFIVYHSGYVQRGTDDEGKWFEGPQGYCLAEKHPGSCKGESLDIGSCNVPGGCGE